MLATAADDSRAVRRPPLRAALPFLPAGLQLALWLVLAPFHGGYFPQSWYPAALVSCAILALAILAGGRALPAARPARIALGLFAAWVAWSYLSLLWGVSDGSGLESSNKLLLYLATGWTLALAPWGERSLAALLGGVAVGIAAVCAWSLVGALGHEDLSGYFLEWRYDHPIGYSNANAAFAVVGFWCALALACRRDLPALAQGGALAVAVFLLEFSLLPQSRGSFVGLLVGGALLFVLAPDRTVLFTRLVVVAGALLVAGGEIFAVYDAGEAGRRIGPVLHDAAGLMLLTSLCAGALGTLLAALQRAARPSSATVRRVRLGGAVALVAVGIAALALVVANMGRLSDTVREEYESFKAGEPTAAQEGGHRLSTLAYNLERADYYRVALDLFGEAPVAGVGAGNFERRYTAMRDELKYSRYVHSLWLRALSETGVVGLLLLLASVLVAAATVALGARGMSKEARWASLGGLVACVGFLVHASFDWVEEVPAVAAPAFGLLFAAVALAAGPGRPAGRAVDERVRAVAVVAGALVALVALLPAYLSFEYDRKAFEVYQRDPDAAFAALDRAQALNPLAIQPLLSEGTIAVNTRRYPRAREAFERALDHEPNWYPYFELALLDAGDGDYAAAERNIDAAAALSANDRFVAAVKRRIARRQPIDAARFNALIARRTKANFTTRQR